MNLPGGQCTVPSIVVVGRMVCHSVWPDFAGKWLCPPDAPLGGRALSQSLARKFSKSKRGRETCGDIRGLIIRWCCNYSLARLICRFARLLGHRWRILCATCRNRRLAFSAYDLQAGSKDATVRPAGLPAVTPRKSCGGNPRRISPPAKQHLSPCPHRLTPLPCLLVASAQWHTISGNAGQECPPTHR